MRLCRERVGAGPFPAAPKLAQASLALGIYASFCVKYLPLLHLLRSMTKQIIKSLFPLLPTAAAAAAAAAGDVLLLILLLVVVVLSTAFHHLHLLFFSGKRFSVIYLVLRPSVPPSLRPSEFVLTHRAHTHMKHTCDDDLNKRERNTHTHTPTHPPPTPTLLPTPYASLYFFSFFFYLLSCRLRFHLHWLHVSVSPSLSLSLCLSPRFTSQSVSLYHSFSLPPSLPPSLPTSSTVLQSTYSTKHT